MSTGNETVQPTTIEPTITADENGANLAQVVSAIEDVDDAELNAALAAVDAEDTTTTPAATGTETAPAAVSQQTQPTEQPGQHQQPAGIPKPRFDEVLGRATKAEQDAAYWRGVAEARAQQQTAPAAAVASQQPAAQTPDQQLAAIATATEDLAKRFDDGEIPMVEYKKQERALQAQENAIREQALLARVQPAPAAQQGSDELYLETLTAQLEQQHPWVGVFDQVASKSDWNYLKDKAVESLVARGVDPTKGSMGRYELRKEMSVLADELGPTLVGAKAQAKGIQLPGTQQQQQPKPAAAISPQAQARAAALAKAANAPPDITALNGHTGNPGGEPTEESLATMDEDAIGNLPTSIRNKLLGIS